MMKISNISPVLPVQNIETEIRFFEALGFFNTYDSLKYSGVLDYAVMTFGAQSIHLQLFEDGNFMGQQLKIWVDDLNPIKGAFSDADIEGHLNENTPWNTHEYGCYSPSRHAIIFVLDLI